MVLIESHLVPETVSAIRLSDYIHTVFSRLPSRKSGKKALKNGLVTVDGKKGSSGNWVKPGMMIQLYEATTSAPAPSSIPIKILYEDEAVIVVYKAAGLATSGNKSHTLLDSVQSVTGSRRIKTVHRLDKATSGIVLLAKDDHSALHLSRQFSEGSIEKKYVAIVSGQMPSKGSIRFSLDNKNSLTDWKVVHCLPSKHYGHITLVNLYPATGRKHQLRKHLKMIGHPIIGDHLYGRPGKIIKGKGMCLVACRLTFTHPLKEFKITIETDVPEKFRKVIPSISQINRYLGNYKEEDYEY